MAGVVPATLCGCRLPPSIYRYLLLCGRRARSRTAPARAVAPTLRPARKKETLRLRQGSPCVHFSPAVRFTRPDVAGNAQTCAT
jgi:hypothetical protein